MPPIGLDSLPGDPFDALGDPHRRAIVELLAGGGEGSVQQLAETVRDVLAAVKQG